MKVRKRVETDLIFENCTTQDIVNIDKSYNGLLSKMEWYGCLKSIIPEEDEQGDPTGLYTITFSCDIASKHSNTDQISFHTLFLHCDDEMAILEHEFLQD